MERIHVVLLALAAAAPLSNLGIVLLGHRLAELELRLDAPPPPEKE